MVIICETFVSNFRNLFKKPERDSFARMFLHSPLGWRPRSISEQYGEFPNNMGEFRTIWENLLTIWEISCTSSQSQSSIWENICTNSQSLSIRLHSPFTSWFWARRIYHQSENGMYNLISVKFNTIQKFKFNKITVSKVKQCIESIVSICIYL